MLLFVDWFETVYYSIQNYFVEMEAENGPEIREESVRLALVVDDTPSSTRTQYDRIRMRRRGDKSNHR